MLRGQEEQSVFLELIKCGGTVTAYVSAETGWGVGNDSCPCLQLKPPYPAGFIKCDEQG